MTEKLVRSIKKEVAGATNARKRTFLFKCPRWSDMLPVGVLTSFIETRVFPLPFLHQAQLFTQDVYEGVCRRL